MTPCALIERHSANVSVESALAISQHGHAWASRTLERTQRYFQVCGKQNMVIFESSPELFFRFHLQWHDTHAWSIRVKVVMMKALGLAVANENLNSCPSRQSITFQEGAETLACLPQARQPSRETTRINTSSYRLPRKQ